MKVVEAVKEIFCCVLGIVNPTYYQSRGWGPWLCWTRTPDSGSKAGSRHLDKDDWARRSLELPRPESPVIVDGRARQVVRPIYCGPDTRQTSPSWARSVSHHASAYAH